MVDPYIGEIRLFAGNYAPYGWLFCNGQILNIAEYDTLAQLLGTRHGGDGATTFGLPDLRGRVPMHTGNGFSFSERGGVEQVTLTGNQMPRHTHRLTAASGSGTSASPQGNVPAAWTDSPYGQEPPLPATLAQASISAAGGNQAHSNLPPYLAINFIIAVYGIYPS